jgi:hypothetical protein
MGFSLQCKNQVANISYLYRTKIALLKFSKFAKIFLEQGLRPYIPKICLGHSLDSSGHSFRHVYKENLYHVKKITFFYIMMKDKSRVSKYFHYWPERLPQSTKLIYLENYSVCPLVGIAPSPQLSRKKRVCFPPEPKGGGGEPLACV